MWLCKSPGLPWWPPADHIWNHFPLEKATQIEPPVPRTGPKDVAMGGTGRVGPDYPTRRVNLSQGSTSSAAGITTFFFFLMTRYFNKIIKESIAGLGTLFNVYFSHSCYLVVSCICLFCDPMDCSPPPSSVHGICQARILEWVPDPGIKSASHTSAGGFFTTEPPGKPPGFS